MKEVRAGLGDHVDGGALRTAIHSRKALRTDLKLLHRFQGQLHDRPAHGIVLVVDPVDRYVDIPSAVAVDRQNGVTVFCGIVRIGRFHPGCQVGEIGHVPADHGEFLDLRRRNILAHIRFGLIDQRRCAGDFDEFRGNAWLQLRVYRGCLTNQNFECLNKSGKT